MRDTGKAGDEATPNDPLAEKPTGGMMRYFTSDLHIGDRTIARWRGFDSVEAHDALLLGRLADCLEADDELWILGDVCKPTVSDEQIVAFFPDDAQWRAMHGMAE